MTISREAFIEIIKSRGLACVEENGALVVKGAGNVYLHSLTALPEGIQFNNQGNVSLPSLTSEAQSYRGKAIRIRTVDGQTMLIQSERRAGDYTIGKARYFGGGEISKLKACYIASNGEHSAHGDTAELALRDLRFKIAQVDFNADELIASVKKAKRITFNEFRLLTGACESGLRHGLASLGLDANMDSLPLAKAMELVRGQFGEDRMKQAFGG